MRPDEDERDDEEEREPATSPASGTLVVEQFNSTVCLDKHPKSHAGWSTL